MITSREHGQACRGSYDAGLAQARRYRHSRCRRNLTPGSVSPARARIWR